MRFVAVCKWCGELNSQVIFEGAHVCNACFEKATLASQKASLCSPCSRIFTNESFIQDLFSEYGASHVSAEYLRESAENGCSMCRMLLLQDPNTDPARLQMNLSLIAERPEKLVTFEPGEFASIGDINLLYFTSEGGQFRLDMSVSACADNPAARFVTQRPIEGNLGGTNTTSMVKKWLCDCLNSHQESMSKVLPCLPSRVIDVGTNDDYSKVRLFETPPEFRSHYVTLSYCWGRPRFLTTLMENIEQHRQGLVIEQLPLTFQNAIELTRDLGFKYLWIDALCIIQDSNEDKAKEIGKMGDIYNDSTLTIAVVSAQAVAEGFLKTRKPQVVDLPFQCPDGVVGSVRVSPRKEIDLWDESLYTRAWCLQENFLSTRLLLYTDTEVIWQCQSDLVKRPSTTHVSYVRENPRLGRSPFNRLPADILKPAEKESVNNIAQDPERYGIWRSLVENYTRRNLTVASDRLPALSGIAQKFRDSWNDNYMFGVWERQLLPSLAWRRSTKLDQPYFARLQEYRAPSWSWASIDGPVEFDFRFDLGNARGLGAKTRSCLHDQNASNIDAIEIEGYAIPITSLPNPKSHFLGSTYLDDHPDDGQWPQFGDNVDHLNEEMKAICLCLLLGEGKFGAGKMMKTTALILMPVSGQADDTFQRIGLWESSIKGTSKLWASPKNKRSLRII